MRQDLGALIALDLRVAVPADSRYCGEGRQFLAVDGEAVKDASLALEHFKRGQAHNLRSVVGTVRELGVGVTEGHAALPVRSSRSMRFRKA